MLKMKRRKNIVLFWIFHASTLSVIAFLLFMMWSAAWNAYGRYAFAKERAEIELTRYNDLKIHKGTLQASLAELKSDFGKEKILRENYSYALPNEKLLIIIDEPDKELLEEKKKKRNLWGKIKEFFLRD